MSQSKTEQPACQYPLSEHHSKDTVTVFVGRPEGPVTLCGMHAQGSLKAILAAIPSGTEATTRARSA